MKVLDFGLVKAVGDSRGDTDGAAHAGERDPGHARVHRAGAGDRGRELDGRADIYATGCVAYWLLTGQFVFTAETPMALLLQHVQTPPAPPSARTDLPIPGHSMSSCCPAWPRTPRTDRSRPESCPGRLAEVEGASAWTQDRAREWWATHQPVRPQTAS